MTTNENAYLGYLSGESWIDRTERLADMCGYPQCCVDDFINGDHQDVRKLTGTGYVPCPECNKKSIEELIEVINNNRKFILPFPHEEFWGHFK